MFKNEFDLKKLIDRLGIDDRPNPVHREDLRRQMLSVFNETLTKPLRTGTWQTIWRTIMKGRISKLAAAAVIVIAVMLSINIFDKSVAPAYAIEQTIEAFKNVRYMHLLQRNKIGQIEDERWVEIGPDGFQARYRQDTPSHGFFVVDDRQTVLVHYKEKNTIILYDPNDKSWTWHYAPGNLFKELADDQRTVMIEKNIDYWGRPAHHVRSKNMEFYIDPDTKLPIAGCGYEFSYEILPEETFDIVIPDGTVVVDKRPGAEPTQEPQWMIDTKSGENLDDIAQEKFNEARKASVSGEYEKAVALFKEVVEIQPGRNWAWFWMGQANYNLGEYNAAIYEFSKVIDMFAKFDVAPRYCHLARAFAYQAKGMEDMARIDFNVALPTMIDSLRHIDAGQFDFADDPMRCGGGFLNDECHKKPRKGQSIAMMINRIRIVTGQNFGYDPLASAEENEQAIAAWEEWYENSGRIEFTPDAELVCLPATSERTDQ